MEAGKRRISNDWLGWRECDRVYRRDHMARASQTLVGREAIVVWPCCCNPGITEMKWLLIFSLAIGFLVYAGLNRSEPVNAVITDQRRPDLTAIFTRAN